MKALLFLPSLLAAGALFATPADAQEWSLRLGGENSALTLDRGKGGIRASGRSHSRGSSYGRSHGISIGVRFGHRPHVCITHRVFVPGHYETVSRRVWIDGFREKVWIEPLYEDRYDACGRFVRVLVRDGHWQVVEHPGHYETRRERVWIPGRHESRGCCD